MDRLSWMVLSGVSSMLILAGGARGQIHESFDSPDSLKKLLVLFGDASGAKQTLWVDDVDITLGPPARVRADSPDAPAPRSRSCPRRIRRPKARR